MKIVQVIDTLSVASGGPARNSFELNVTLNQLESVEARLFYLRGTVNDSVLSGYSGDAGPLPARPPKRVSLRRGDNTIDLRSALREIAEADVLVVHQYFLWWIAPIVFLSKVLGTPVVVTPHGSLTSHQQKFSVTKKRIFEVMLGWWVRSNLAGWVTGSQIEKDDLVRLYPEKPVAVGGVGTPLPEVNETEGDWNRPLRLLALSRIAPKKRHDLMLGALERLIDAGVDAELDIVGTGPSGLVDELKRRVEMLGLVGKVHFHGQKAGAEKISAFRGSDIYLLPSDDENFGISLAEALSYGVPSVVSAGVASSQFMNSGAGRVLSAPTPDSIAQAITDVVSGDRRNAAGSARACAEASFSWHAAATRWVSCLHDLTATKLLSSGKPPRWE